MAETDESEGADDSWVPVYVAGNVKEAKRVEQALEDGNVEYALRHQKYTTFLFGSYDGVAFDVDEADRERAVEFLRRTGLKRGLIR